MSHAPVQQPMVPSYAAPLGRRPIDLVAVSRGTAFKIGFYAWLGAMTAAIVLSIIAVLVAAIAGISVLSF